MIYSIKNCLSLINRLYVQSETPLEKLELLLLLIKYLNQFPKTLIITAEYGFLRIKKGAFVKRLVNTRVEIRLLRYQGIDHALVDKCGAYPQAEGYLIDMTEPLKLLFRFITKNGC